MIYKMKIEPLTFVHIGSGQEIDFFGYIILDKVFYRINIWNFYNKLKKEEDKKEFSIILEKMSSTDKEELRKGRIEFREFFENCIKFLQDHPEKSKEIIIYKGLVDDEVFEIYKIIRKILKVNL